MVPEMPDEKSADLSPSRGVIYFTGVLMSSKLHIVRTHFDRTGVGVVDTLLLCGARVSQNGALMYMEAPPAAMSEAEIRRREPDICAECLRQLKIRRSENPQKARVVTSLKDRPKFGGREEFDRDLSKPRGQINKKQEKTDGYNRKG